MQFLLFISIIFSTISFSLSYKNGYGFDIVRNYSDHANDYLSSISLEETPEKIKEEERIIGGIDTNVKAYPFIVSIQKRQSKFHFCGGSILSDTLILSAAHCFISEHQSCCCILAGQTYIRNNDVGTGQRINIQQTVIHQGYNQATLHNDIACCRLVSPLTFTPTVQAVHIPDAEHFGELADKVQNVVVIGWGVTQMGGPTSSTLQQVRLPVIELNRCQALYADMAVSDTQMCTLYSDGGKDSCQGDSGGPVVAADNRTVQYGLVSYGVNCAEPQHPGVNTRVDKYLDFIKRCLDKNDPIYQMPNPTPSNPDLHHGMPHMSCSNNLLPLTYLIPNLMCIFYLL